MEKGKSELFFDVLKFTTLKKSLFTSTNKPEGLPTYHS